MIVFYSLLLGFRYEDSKGVNFTIRFGSTHSLLFEWIPFCWLVSISVRFRNKMGEQGIPQSPFILRGTQSLCHPIQQIEALYGSNTKSLLWQYHSVFKNNFIIQLSHQKSLIKCLLCCRHWALLPYFCELFGKRPHSGYVIIKIAVHKCKTGSK